MKKLSYFGIIFFVSFLSQSGLQAMNQDSNNFYSIILPGQNGMGGESFQGFTIINTRQVKKFETLQDLRLIDLGQDNCISDFERQLNADEQEINTKLLLYGVSQGTATLLNWLSKKTHQEQEQQVGCLFLESILGSGNSAINHTIESCAKPLSYIPLSRYWLPLLAKFQFPSYNPWGKQALTSAQKLSPKIPVIIMHNIHDKQLSINDARKLYCMLREIVMKMFIYLKSTVIQ